jgi:hypothetical protein
MVYHGIVDMSRGLSKYQCEILKRLDNVYLVYENGEEKRVPGNYLTVMDAEKVVWKLKHPKIDALGDALHATGATKVSDIANVSAFYRMLYSLEKRGLIGMVVGLYPRVWLKLKWEDSKPSVVWSSVLYDKIALHLADKKGVLGIRTKGTVWVYDFRSMFKGI